MKEITQCIDSSVESLPMGAGADGALLSQTVRRLLDLVVIAVSARWYLRVQVQKRAPQQQQKYTRVTARWLYTSAGV